MSETETLTRAYELGYLLVPTAPESEIPTLIEQLKSAIKKVGGTVASEGHPEFIDLAYTMEKHIGSKKMKYSQGYFGWMKLEATPESVETLKKTLDATVDVIRYLLVKTNLENVTVFKKPKIEAKRESSAEGVEIADEMVLEDETIDIKEDHEILPDVLEDVVVETVEPEEEEEKA